MVNHCLACIGIFYEWIFIEFKRGEILLIVRIRCKKGHLLVFVQTLNFFTTRYCRAIREIYFSGQGGKPA